jgi:hypothetical protein
MSDRERDRQTDRQKERNTDKPTGRNQTRCQMEKDVNIFVSPPKLFSIEIKEWRDGKKKINERKRKREIVR